MSEIRKFESGATRNSNEGKLNIEGFMHPLVLQRFCQYMHLHRFLEDGSVRLGDNWQLGITKESAIDSGLRHVMDWWLEHRGYESRDGIEDALCGVLFNVQSYLLTVLQEKEKYDDAITNTMEHMNSVDPPQSFTIPFASNMTPAEIENYKKQQAYGVTNIYATKQAGDLTDMYAPGVGSGLLTDTPLSSGDITPISNMLKKLGLKK